MEVGGLPGGVVGSLIGGALGLAISWFNKKMIDYSYQMNGQQNKYYKLLKK